MRICTIHHSPMTMLLSERDKIENYFKDTEFHELEDFEIFPNLHDICKVLEEYYSRFNEFYFVDIEDNNIENKPFKRFKFECGEEYFYVNFQIFKENDSDLKYYF